MPNLEYSVKFVLASDATAEIDEALRKMRETGSTINIKVNVDSTSVSNSLKSVETELKKIEEGSQKLGGSADKSTKQFNKLSNEIRKAATEFKATGEIQDKARDFEILGKRVEDYGARLRDAGRDLDTYFQLKNKLAEAEKTHTNEMNNSKLVLDARAKAEAFLAKQQRAANRELTDNTRGTIAELRRLSVEGKGSAEQITRLFNRAVVSAEDLEITTTDLTQAYAGLRASIEGSNLSYKTRQTLLNSIKVAEEQSAQSMRVMNRGLAQQQNQVGDVSYAMMSFTRLLEDIPYGFRGFANNIQPTIFGLVQLNDQTVEAAENFRKVHGKEMPLMQRAMLNLKTAFTGPINQIMLLTSVLAVAGTFIERWMQQSKEVEKAAKALSDRYLDLYNAVSLTNSVLNYNYQESVDGLTSYASASAQVTEQLQKQIDAQKKVLANTIGAARGAARGVDAQRIKNMRAVLELDEERLAVAKTISDEAKERLKTLNQEKAVNDQIAQTEIQRQQILQQEVAIRNRNAVKTLEQARDQLAIEKVRATLGDEAAAKKRMELAIDRATINGVIAKNDALLAEAQYQLEIFQIGQRKLKQTKEVRAEYAGILEALRRQLEDEKEMFALARLKIDREREIADMTDRVAERRKEGEKISAEQEQALIDLIDERYDILDQRAKEASDRAIQDLAEQAQMNEMLVQLEQKRLQNGDLMVVESEFQIMQLEHEQELRKAIAEITNDSVADEKAKAKLIEATTKNLENQLRLQIQQRLNESAGAVRDFLGDEDQNIVAVTRDRNNALIAQEEAYRAELLLIKKQYGKDSEMYLAEEARITADNARLRQEITDKAEKQIAFIKYKYATDGILMVSGALEQLVSGMEAKNKKQFEQQKALSIGLATMNAYLAVSQVLRDPTIVPSWMKYPMAAAMLIQGLAQVNSIRNTKYGGGTPSGGVRGGRPSQQEGFQEVLSPPSAMGGVIGTMRQERAVVNVSVVGNVDREGIAFAVREGENMISSRATFAR